MSALAFLLAPRDRWVDIDVEVGRISAEGRIEVRSLHTDATGGIVHRFDTSWDDAGRPSTEYSHGLSVIHDVKDHVFHGLGITPLTEIQTIVQTYYGREISPGEHGRSEGGDYLATIREHVFHELFGLEGRPLVYELSLQRGLLDMYAPDASAEERDEAYLHMCTICEDVMLPSIQAAYDRTSEMRALQASPRDQPDLVEALLPGVVWCDRPRLLLRLQDNQGLRLRARAFVDPGLAETTRAIRDRVADYAAAHELQRYGRIFDVTGYVAS